MGDLQETCIVVPCYNEARRLDLTAWGRLGRHPAIRLLFVDDGSTDGTRRALRRLVDSLPRGRAAWCTMDSNVGKAEAVRYGLRRALKMPVAWVGYVDADLSTPVDEVIRLVENGLCGSAEVILGCRIQLLGHDVTRSPWRHYLGRLFATCASFTLSMPVYDTQCGTKFFRRGPQISAALRHPFASRWIFDVELLGRLVYPAEGVGMPPKTLLEAPLLAWHAKAGSKLRLRDFLRAIGELFVIYRTVRQHPARRGVTGKHAAKAPDTPGIVAGWRRLPARFLPKRPGAVTHAPEQRVSSNH